MENLKKFKKDLDKISPTFCVAKWKQVTMHLESGLTHSCHHPKTHKVPLNELKINKTALHNTSYKKKMRLKMLNGEIVEECKYCNIIEQDKKNKNIFSDRIYKSREPWAYKYLSDIKNKSSNDNVFPSYVEVDFSSVCNCSCIYCSPLFSTSWNTEIKKFGDYNTSSNEKNLNNYHSKTKDNPYVKAFWEWWPELYKNLDFFRITGGEPLLSKQTFKILDYIAKNPKHDFNFSINSNFTIKQEIFKKFILKCKNIKEKINVYTSCEAKGIKAEYIRTGLNYDYWLNNCRTYLKEIPNGSLTLMCTYNILSISSFKNFLEDVLKLKKDFPLRVKIDIPYLISPTYLQPNIISKDFLKYIEEAVTFMFQNIDIPEWFPLSGTKFFRHEVDKLLRIYFMVQAKPYNNGCKQARKDFIIFINEHDKRYNTNFLEIFPEYTNFYKECEEL